MSSMSTSLLNSPPRENSFPRPKGTLMVYSIKHLASLVAVSIFFQPSLMAQSGETATGVPNQAGEWVRSWMPENFQEEVLFLEHWQWIGIVVLLIAAWFTHKLTVAIGSGVLVRLLARGEKLSRTSGELKSISRAVGWFTAAAAAYLLIPFLDLPPEGSRILIIFTKMIASVGGLLLSFRLADLAGARLEDAASTTESKLDDQLAPMVRKSLKVLVTVAAFLFILDNLDVDIVSFLAGLGVVGIGVGLAAKDTFANLFGSVTVFADRPFQVGDWVVMGGVEGTVEEIGFRCTRVRTFYNSVVSVPNSCLVDAPIDNMGARRYRRFRTMVGVRYETPAAKIEAFCAGIREIVKASDRMRQDYYMVHLNNFGASSLDILVYVFFEVPDWGAELQARQDFILEIVRLAEDLGVGFAFPSQSLYIEGTPEKPFPVQESPGTEVLQEIVTRYGSTGSRSRPRGTEEFST